MACVPSPPLFWYKTWPATAVPITGAVDSSGNGYDLVAVEGFEPVGDGEAIPGAVFTGAPSGCSTYSCVTFEDTPPLELSPRAFRKTVTRMYFVVHAIICFHSKYFAGGYVISQSQVYLFLHKYVFRVR